MGVLVSHLIIVGVWRWPDVVVQLDKTFFLLAQLKNIYFVKYLETGMPSKGSFRRV